MIRPFAGLLRAAVLWFAVALAGAAPLAAQTSLRVQADSVRVADLLVDLGARARIDIVYASRLVGDRRTSCHYDGTEVEAALACILSGSGLVHERVGRHQFIVRRRQSATGSAIRSGVVSGFVLDAETGEALPGAHVYVPGRSQGTATNEAGFFSLPGLPRGVLRVRVSYLGYAIKDTSLASGGSPKRVVLERQPIQAAEVVVDGRESEAMNAMPGLIGRPVREIERLPSFIGGKDLLQALQWVPGVRRAGGVGGGLSIQGGTPDQNLFLIDGAPIYHPWHAFSLVSTFQTETFKNVALYRGAFPPEHGGRLAAVLDAEMRDGNLDEPRALVGAGIVSARFLAEGPVTPRTSFMVSGRRSIVDQLIGDEHPVEENGVRDTLRTGYYFYDMSAKVTHHAGERHKLSVAYYEGRDALDLRLPFDLSLDFSSWLEPANLFFEVDHSWTNRLVSARYQYLPTRRSFITLTGYHSAYDATEDLLLRPTSNSRINTDYGVTLSDAGVKLDVDYYHSLHHQMRAGLQAVARRFDSDVQATLRYTPGSVEELTGDSRLRALETVLYAQDVWHPSRRWVVRQGLRASFFSRGRYVHLMPRLYVRYAIEPERWLLQAGVGRHVQYLHRLRDREALLYDVVSSRWVPTGDEVRPSRSWYATLGLQAEPFTSLQFDLDLYARYTQDHLVPADLFQVKDRLIGTGIDLATLLQQYEPASRRVLGATAELRYRARPWDVRLTYELARTRLTTDEGTRSYHDRYDLPHSLEAVVSRTFRDWTLSVSSELRSGLPLTVPEARYALGDVVDGERVYLYRPQPFNGRLPPYLRIDLRVGRAFEWLGAAWQVQGQLYNVISRRNVLSRRFLPEEEGVRVLDRRGLPIVPLIEAEVRF